MMRKRLSGWQRCWGGYKITQLLLAELAVTEPVEVPAFSRKAMSPKRVDHEMSVATVDISWQYARI
jgi:hypothetical protein